tara:strand:- start:13501 stop:13827 length:327 start_codon:yes stop_codon:yes gene_type:complete
MNTLYKEAQQLIGLRNPLGYEITHVLLSGNGITIYYQQKICTGECSSLKDFKVYRKQVLNKFEYRRFCTSFLQAASVDETFSAISIKQKEHLSGKAKSNLAQKQLVLI